ncbi:hypothetical protein [Mycoplasmopsis alligatoris]|uniref:Uncharacterized protein n=1 Tax=Mycoplasmopsis alligatoris A21JP2 TaxID=747682 RepID=D4XWQ5_9BACT|nr:hypothetical protein [Mycoplasmopsis alligatoris]EFF41223.1 hypothetical protein MALL_0373 [Mycoplasmopsis alligatoris A21JP2]
MINKPFKNLVLFYNLKNPNPLLLGNIYRKEVPNHFVDKTNFVDLFLNEKQYEYLFEYEVDSTLNNEGAEYIEIYLNTQPYLISKLDKNYSSVLIYGGYNEK